LPVIATFSAVALVALILLVHLLARVA